jgi:hypothetical protein
MGQKLNDHTYYESQSIVAKNDSDWFRESCICREFNFLSRQRTTTVEFVLWNKGTKQHSLAVSTTIDNFRDIEGEDEIARAHKALLDLGGKPPALDEILDRKSLRLAPATPKGSP